MMQRNQINGGTRVSLEFVLGKGMVDILVNVNYCENIYFCSDVYFVFWYAYRYFCTLHELRN